MTPDLIGRAASRFDLLELLGGAHQRVSATRGGEWAGPCPLCGGRDRCRAWPHREAGPRAWCRGCGAEGDAIRWAMFIDGRDPDRPGETGRWLRKQRVVLPPVCSKPPCAGPSPAPLRRLPPEEVAQLWTDSWPVTKGRLVGDWLESRAIDPAAVEAQDLARALPPRGKLPSWASPWRRSGHLVLLPVHDWAGRMVGVRARAVTTNVRVKEFAPRGQGSRGLVYASPAALEMLRGTPAKRVVICEGWPDFATWATRLTDAVLGIYAGAWSDNLAARVSDRAEVLVRRHDDAPGGKYAMQVARSLAGRCRVAVLEPAARGGVA
ncbi:MAG: hypothetical protein JKY65_05475 [Planctomycetes bacterium]|nr:hypothetical protein [Planctomycetota bacterium]